MKKKDIERAKLYFLMSQRLSYDNASVSSRRFITLYGFVEPKNQIIRQTLRKKFNKYTRSKSTSDNPINFTTFSRLTNQK